MITIAQNPIYQVLVEVGENRLYLRVMGAWEAQKEIPNYITHLKEALAFLTPGFSVLCDIREMGDISPAVQEMFLHAQKLILEAGVDQIAEVHTLNNPGSEIAIALAHQSRIPLNIFDNLADAMAWLEER